MEALAADDPRQVGRYRLLRRLGAGGMGRVYLGRTQGGRTVAVKLVRADLADDGEFRARFRQEVAAAHRVGGVWTAPVLEADIEGATPWVATGYVAGPALDAAVREFGALPEESVRALGVGLAEALAAVHAAGLVHRDLKPSNVLLALDGPRVIDFGIARALDAATALTRSGYVVGSPGYLSPEQAAGREAGPAGDVFALGGVLAYAATGRGPFGDGVSAPVLLYRVLHEQPRLEGISYALAAVLRDCLAKAPEDRPTPAEARAALLTPGVPGLGTDAWLPPRLIASIGRRTAELLDLEAGPGGGEEAPESGPAAPEGTAAGPRPASHRPPRGPAPAPRPEPLRHAPGPAGPAAPTPPGPAGPSGAPATGPSAAAAGGPPGVGTASPHDAVPGTTAATAAPPVPGTGRDAVPAAGGGGLPGRPAGPRDARRPPVRRGTLTAGAAALGVAAAAALVALVLPGGRPVAHAGAGAGGGTAAPAGSVPARFVGVWQGTITTHFPQLTTVFRVTIRQGAAGTAVTSSRNTSAGGSVHCDGRGVLVRAAGGRLVIEESPAGGTAGQCLADQERQTYTLNPDGTLHVAVDDPVGGSPSGDLRRQ